MYIRIEFDQLESKETQRTMFLFFGSPNGTFLCSRGASPVCTRAIDAASGGSVAMWYVDEEVVEKYYNGVERALTSLRSYTGVKRVDVIPFTEHPSQFTDRFEELDTILLKYVDGV